MDLKAGLRRLWRAPLVASWVLLGLLLASLLYICPVRWRDTLRQQVTIGWMRGLLHLLPLRIHRHGKPTEQQAVWVGNHISWLDIILLGAAGPVRFIAKSDVRQWPLLGWLAHSAGTLFIQRGRANADSFKQHMETLLAQRHSLAIFAEGTTTLGDRVRTFHGRLLSCAVEQKVPLQPVALRYHHQGELARVAAFIQDDAFFNHLWRLLGSSPIEVELYFLPLIDSCGVERNPLARSARHAVIQALGQSDPCQSTDAKLAA